MHLLRYIKIELLFLLTILPVFSLSSQTLTIQKLRDSIAENNVQFQLNIDTAYKSIDFLLSEAQLLSDTISQLTLLDRRCRYYYNKHYVEELFVSSELYQKKAYEYNSPNDQIMSGVYMAEAYSMNELPDNALKELEKVMPIVDKRKATTTKDIVTKVNLLSSFANIYAQKGEPQTSVRYLLAADDEFAKSDDSERVKRFQHVNYSNLANTYLDYNVDSAVYYASMSLSLYPDEEDQDQKIVAQNHYILGKGFEEEQNYQLALDNYLKAYNLYVENGIELNVESLYVAIIEMYLVLEDPASAKKYEDLLNEYELRTLKKKYSSMHRIYTEYESAVGQDKKLSRTVIAIIIIGFVLLTLSLFYFYIRYKKNKKELRVEHYDTMMDLISKNNSDFMILFDEIYPEFTKKLLAIDPELTRSEIEFCAFLKLNLSTKQIAQMRFIEVRTVQNRKYRIRKKLDIPSTVDLYNWFDSI